MVFIATFINKKSYWELNFFDAICGILSAIALGVWMIVDYPRYAILIAATGDGFAALPTILKAWKYPETENGMIFVASLISVLLVIPSIDVWNIENASFQIYLLVINTILVFAVYRRKIFLRSLNKA